MKIKFNEVEDEYKRKLDKLFGVNNCLIEVNPGKVLLPPKYEELGEQILNLEVRPDDVWLASYPRTGNHSFLPIFHFKKIWKYKKTWTRYNVF